MFHPDGSAESLQLAGRLDEARKAYEARLGIAPDDARTLSNYGGCSTSSTGLTRR
ncbi:hypothetical protein [Asaia prunellae]|uniref:hypothetical protein n=1 Tax=Asaia prunellae TaxID=610245 RepID=UPI000AF2D683|nr:hypothetical protein [Asaia prunellae]